MHRNVVVAACLRRLKRTHRGAAFLEWAAHVGAVRARRRVRRAGAMRLLRRWRLRTTQSVLSEWAAVARAAWQVRRRAAHRDVLVLGRLRRGWWVLLRRTFHEWARQVQRRRVKRRGAAHILQRWATREIRTGMYAWRSLADGRRFCRRVVVRLARRFADGGLRWGWRAMMVAAAARGSGEGVGGVGEAGEAGEASEAGEADGVRRQDGRKDEDGPAEVAGPSIEEAQHRIIYLEAELARRDDERTAASLESLDDGGGSNQSQAHELVRALRQQVVTLEAFKAAATRKATEQANALSLAHDEVAEVEEEVGAKESELETARAAAKGLKVELRALQTKYANVTRAAQSHSRRATVQQAEKRVEEEERGGGVNVQRDERRDRARQEQGTARMQRRMRGRRRREALASWVGAVEDRRFFRRVIGRLIIRYEDHSLRTALSTWRRHMDALDSEEDRSVGRDVAIARHLARWRRAKLAGLFLHWYKWGRQRDRRHVGMERLFLRRRSRTLSSALDAWGWLVEVRCLFRHVVGKYAGRLRDHRLRGSFGSWAARVDVDERDEAKDAWYDEAAARFLRRTGRARVSATFARWSARAWEQRRQRRGAALMLRRAQGRAVAVVLCGWVGYVEGRRFCRRVVVGLARRREKNALQSSVASWWSLVEDGRRGAAGVGVRREWKSDAVRRFRKRIGRATLRGHFVTWTAHVRVGRELKHRTHLALRRWRRHALGDMFARWSAGTGDRVFVRRVVRGLMRRLEHKQMMRSVNTLRRHAEEVTRTEHGAVVVAYRLHTRSRQVIRQWKWREKDKVWHAWETLAVKRRICRRLLRRLEHRYATRSRDRAFSQWRKTIRETAHLAHITADFEANHKAHHNNIVDKCLSWVKLGKVWDHWVSLCAERHERNARALKQNRRAVWQGAGHMFHYWCEFVHHRKKCRLVVRRLVRRKDKHGMVDAIHLWHAHVRVKREHAVRDLLILHRFQRGRHVFMREHLRRWKAVVVGQLSHNVWAQRMMQRWAKRDMCNMFRSWVFVTEQCRGRRHRVRQALQRWRLRELHGVLGTWCDLVDSRQLCRRVMLRVIKRHENATLSRGFVSWQSAVYGGAAEAAEAARREAVVVRCVRRMGRVALARTFNGWVSRAADQKSLRHRSKQALQRWRMRELHGVLGTWCDLVDSRQLCRRVIWRLIKRHENATLSKGFVSWRALMDEGRCSQLLLDREDEGFFLTCFFMTLVYWTVPFHAFPESDKDNRERHRRALGMLLRWRGRALGSTFGAWQTFAKGRSAARATMLKLCRRREVVALSRSYVAWCEHARAKRRREIEAQAQARKEELEQARTQERQRLEQQKRKAEIQHRSGHRSGLVIPRPPGMIIAPTEQHLRAHRVAQRGRRRQLRFRLETWLSFLAARRQVRRWLVHLSRRREHRCLRWALSEWRVGLMLALNNEAREAQVEEIRFLEEAWEAKEDSVVEAAAAEVLATVRAQKDSQTKNLMASWTSVHDARIMLLESKHHSQLDEAKGEMEREMSRLENVNLHLEAQVLGLLHQGRGVGSVGGRVVSPVSLVSPGSPGSPVSPGGSGASWLIRRSPARSYGQRSPTRPASPGSGRSVRGSGGWSPGKRKQPRS